VRGTDRDGREGTFEIDAVSGDVLRQVVHHMFRLARWSNHGPSVIFQEHVERVGSSRVVRRDLETGLDEEVFATEAPSALRRLRVSQDGRHVAFVHQHPPTSSHRLMVMPTSGGDARVLARFPDSSRIRIGDWSPDGRFVLIQLKLGQNEPNEVIRVAVSDGDMLPLALEGEGLRDVSVHPDGRHIAYTAGWPVIDVVRDEIRAPDRFG